MMTKEQLKEAIDAIKEIGELADKLMQDYKVDIIETPAFQAPGKLFDLLIESNYNEEGADWIYYWCFECNYGENVNAMDEEGNPICKTFDDLYEYCKQYERV